MIGTTGTEGGVRGRQGSYVAISPCRNEIAHLVRSVDSVLAQTVLPARWVIVDDGSTDGTSEALDRYAVAHDFIRVVRRGDRGKRSVGPGVIEAFDAGLAEVPLGEYDYLVKLDLDLDLPPHYFEILVRRMEEDPRLGSCSGKPYFVRERDGRLVSEACGDEMSVGMTKFYRVTCFREIGGFVGSVMWDGIDCHQSRMNGWTVRSWDEPELRFTHLRPMGSSEHGIWRGRMRHGGGQYYMGTSPLYMLASALYRMTRPPLLIGGLGMLAGYVSAMIRRQPRHDDRRFRRYLRRYQFSSLIRGKRRAVRRLEAEGRAVWEAARRHEIDSRQATSDATVED